MDRDTHIMHIVHILFFGCIGLASISVVIVVVLFLLIFVSFGVMESKPKTILQNIEKQKKKKTILKLFKINFVISNGIFP